MYQLTKGVTPSELKAMFSLDLDNVKGSGILWKEHPSNPLKKNTMAGGRKSGKGACYWRVYLNGRSYHVHHIVALLADLPRCTEMRKLAKSKQANVLVVDHLNNGTFPDYSNHPLNLEIVTHRENVSRGKVSSNKKLIGASYRKDTGKWRSNIRWNGYRYSLGTYDTEQEAHESYLIALKKVEEGRCPVAT